MSKRDDKTVIDAEWSRIDSAEQEEKKQEQGQEQESKQQSTVTEEQGELIVLEREHQRFYDKLRKKIEDFIKKQTGDKLDNATQYILLAPDLFVLFARLIQDKRVPTKSKAIAGMVVAYFISPVDLVPEILTGPIGYMDDIILAAYAISRILNDVDKSVVLKHWNGEADLLHTVQELLKKAEDLLDTRVFGAIKKMFKK